MDMRTIKVNTNDLRVGKSPDVLYTKNIGSCVAIALYDMGKRIGGLAHVSLPAKIDTEPDENLHKYAGIAIDALLRIMARLGCLRRFTVAKIVGGGNMFDTDLEPHNDVGRLNVAAAREALYQNQIPITKEDVLGTESRNVSFDLSKGRVKVTSPGGGETIL